MRVRKGHKDTRTQEYKDSTPKYLVSKGTSKIDISSAGTSKIDGSLAVQQSIGCSQDAGHHKI